MMERLAQLVNRLKLPETCAHRVRIGDPCETCEHWWLMGEEAPGELPAGWVRDKAGRPRATR